MLEYESLMQDPGDLAKLKYPAIFCEIEYFATGEVASNICLNSLSSVF